jgi:hypothetical protein
MRQYLALFTTLQLRYWSILCKKHVTADFTHLPLLLDTSSPLKYLESF